MEGIVGITGTPGTGKKSVAPLVAARLGLKCYALNDLAHLLGVQESPDGSVDTDELKRRLHVIEGSAVIYGHLLPYSFEKDAVSRMIVLRCEPSALKRRLKKRGYSGAKLVENVEAELIGLESSDAFDAFGPAKTFEVDTTRLTPAASAERLCAVLNRKKEQAQRLDWVPSYDAGAKLRSLLSPVGS